MTRKYSIDDCQIIQVPKVDALNGHIAIVEKQQAVPFDVKRLFYLYDIEAGESRGAHAHLECHQFLVAVTGAFEVELDDGVRQKKVLLNQPFYGLHIPPGIWAAEVNFSGASVCLVLASETYDEADYIRDYQEFINYVNKDSSDR